MTYKEQLADPRWQKKRLRILERDDFKCKICLDETSQLQIHHKRYEYGLMAWEADDSDLVTVCHACHKVAEELKLLNATPIVGYKKTYFESDQLCLFVISIDINKIMAIHFYEIKGNYVHRLLGLSKQVVDRNMELFAHAEKLIT